MSIGRRNWLAGLALSPLAGAAAAYATSDPESSLRTRCGPLGEARERQQQRRLPNVEVVTHEGERVRFFDDLIKDRKVAINVMYTHCEGICPPATRNLVEVQKMLGDRMGRDIFFYSISLKPQEDTPAVLADYAERNRVGPGWQFLTGAPEDIERLRVALGFTYSDPAKDADVSNHLGHMRLVVEPALRWGHTLTMASPKHIYRSMRFEFDSPTLRMNT